MLKAVLALLLASAIAVPASAIASSGWAPTGSTAGRRADHAAAVLPGGDVLIAGGFSGSCNCVALATAEIYHVGTGTWSRTEGMHRHAGLITLTPLLDGRVLAAGPGTNAELFNPATGSWGSVRDAVFAPEIREGHTATRLNDGKVLIAGSNILSERTTAVYDPATDAWSPAGELNVSHWFATATLLRDGRVLVAGGRTAHRDRVHPGDPDFEGDTSAAEIYEPATRKWTLTAPMRNARAEAAAVRLADGRVMVIGAWSTLGNTGVPYTTEIYDPASGRWSAAASMTHPRSQPTATLLPDGRVLVTGATGGPVVDDDRDGELYLPDSDRWVPAGRMGTPHDYGSATLLPTGKVLVAGGYAGAIDPVHGWAAGTWTAELFTPPGPATSLSLAPSSAANVVGSTHTVTATARNAAGNPVGGTTVRFSVSGANTAAGSSATNATGQASFTYTGSNVGSDRIGAFADNDADGDRDDGEPQATASKLWFAFAPGGGSFVVGDRSVAAGTRVTFWDAQWWKLNPLSGGVAPPSFKGFAATGLPPACGAGWSADPERSAPPGGPLPTDMGVIVASHVTKSGPRVAGDTTHVVVVKTAPGYQPGHAATGTIEALVC